MSESRFRELDQAWERAQAQEVVGKTLYENAVYDWSRTKGVWASSDFCPPGKWMVVCNVDKGPGFRRYFDSQKDAFAFARAWLDCQHDRTPQPKFNAHGGQCGWWQPTYEAECIRSLQKQLLARADELAEAIKKAEKDLQPGA